MKRILISMTINLLATMAIALTPATLTITNIRSEVEDYASSAEIVRGIPLILTNCVAFTGTTTSTAREDLTGVSINVKIGIPSTNISYTGAAQDATNGTYYCVIATFPTNWNKPSIQVQLTNASANVIYPLKTIKTQQGL